MPHLIAVAGLPGSGKSHYVHQQAREHGLTAFSDVTQHDWRDWPALAVALSLGVPSIVDSATFCDPEGREALERRVAALPRNGTAQVEWRFFEADPDACLANILRDVFLRPDREHVGRLRSFWRRKDAYQIPAGATVLPVYRTADCVELGYGRFRVEIVR